MFQYDKKFMEFWRVYPRRVGKQKAYRAWQGVIEKEYADAEQIIDAAKIFSSVNEWRGDLQFCPHPLTWLNQGRYEDEYEAEDLLSKAERAVLNVVRSENSGDVCDPLDKLLSFNPRKGSKGN